MAREPIKSNLSGDVNNPMRGLKDIGAHTGDLPPVHLWNPPFCGDIDMRIAQDGTWFFMNSPIGRKPLVKLFSSILRREEDGKYHLVTPVEKCGIVVDDAPLVVIQMSVEGRGRKQVVRFLTQTDDVVTVDRDHPLRFKKEERTGGLKPYVLVRGRLEALVNRPTFYELVAKGTVVEQGGAKWFGVLVVGQLLAHGACPRHRSGPMSEPRFDEEEVKRRARVYLLDTAPTTHNRGDDDLNSQCGRTAAGEQIRAAAVLIPIVVRRPEVTVLLTQRTEHLALHAGQIAFPGGRVDDADADVVATALREAQEETGLCGKFVEPLGFLEAYLTRSNFRVVPVVALVRPGFSLSPATDEVACVFEVPLRFLMTPRNHAIHSRQFLGEERRFHAIAFGDRYIWGATAGMLMNFYDRMYGHDREA